MVLQQLSALLDWFASPQGANYLRACFSLATVPGLDGRIVAAVAWVFHLWLALQ